MEERLQEALLLKEQGNQRYREGRFRAAAGRYHRALLQLRGLEPGPAPAPVPVPDLGPRTPVLTPAQEDALRNTQTACYNNLAGGDRGAGMGVCGGDHWLLQPLRRGGERRLLEAWWRCLAAGLTSPGCASGECVLHSLQKTAMLPKRRSVLGN